MKNINFAVLAISFLVTLNVTSQALAIDSKNYPGSMCTKVGTGTGTGSLIYYYNGSVGNGSYIDSLTVVCPVIKDARSIKSGWVMANDQHYNADIICGLYVGNETESSPEVRAGDEIRTVGAGQPFQIIRTTSGTTYVSGYSRYYWRCSIPPVYWNSNSVSTIRAYGVTEND